MVGDWKFMGREGLLKVELPPPILPNLWAEELWWARVHGSQELDTSTAGNMKLSYWHEVREEQERLATQGGGA